MKGLDWELFDRYLAGQATPDERGEFERWLAESPERGAALDAWRRALNGLENEISSSDRAAVWSHVSEQIAASLPMAQGRLRIDSRRPSFGIATSRSHVRFGIAAAAALVLGAVLTGRALLTHDERSETVPERVVTVPYGKRARFHLPDGTEVMLAAGSTLRHPRTFGGTSRDVTLEGEAYFTVEHDAGRPFRVQAGDLIATDRGTEFLVRAYPEDTKARVVVRSGTVAIRPIRPSTAVATERVIRPGELGRLGADGVPQVERVDTAAYFSWIHGILALDGTPLRDALPQLSRWYNLQLQLADTSLGSIPLTARLDQTLTETRLDLLAASLGLKQVRRGRQVTFSRP